jgi:hypothetical protein
MSPTDRRLWIFFLFGFSFSLPAGAVEPLGRKFDSIRLGITVKAFLKIVPGEEHKDLYLDLVEGERVFEVPETSLPKGIARLNARFFKDRLYKISVEHTRDSLTEEAWASLLDRLSKRHGKVPAQQQPMRESVYEIHRWEDPATVYILQREIRMRKKDEKLVSGFTVFDTYLDKPIWEERLQAERGLF